MYSKKLKDFAIFPFPALSEIPPRMFFPFLCLLHELADLQNKFSEIQICWPI